jgi:hypothetical protein
MKTDTVRLNDSIDMSVAGYPTGLITHCLHTDKLGLSEITDNIRDLAAARGRQISAH